MPRPKPEESKEDYIARFMKSAEAQSDYPDEKQRLAVAYSLYEHKNMLENAGAWPMSFKSNHLEPGLVRYQDLNDGKGATLLLRKETIDKMRPTFKGKPVVNEVHKNVEPEGFKNGDHDGVVVDGYFDGADGQEWATFMAWDPLTQKNCMSNAYGTSCAYKPTKIDDTPGTWHNIPYDGEILDGEYTHLAIVANPRYEGARILANSKEDTQMIKLRFWKKDVKNAADLDAQAAVEIDGKQVKVLELVNAFKADEAKKAAAASSEDLKNMADDTMIEIDGKEMPLKNLKDMYRNNLKNADDEEKEKKKMAEEKKNAEDAKAKEDKEKEERKNAEDAEKKKKEDEERKNAESKEDKEHFNSLKSAAALRGEPAAPKIMTMRERVEEGARRYGSGK